MKVIFAGTPAFALPTLQMVHAAHDVVAVYTQPDRPAGRGRQVLPSPVKEYALTHRLAVFQPATLRGAEEELAAFDADIMVVVAYGLLLPPAVLAVPPRGCVNVHASLLPRWRGAAPIARAIEAGDIETGISIMQMEAGLDTGPILRQAHIPIRESDTRTTLEERLSRQGADTLRPTLELLAQEPIVAQPQDDSRACYAPKLEKREAPIDWTQPALRLHRKVRAFNPWPVASSSWRGQVLRLWDVGPLDTTSRLESAEPGTVLATDAEGLRVQTGAGALTITRLQAPGSRAMPVREFLNGNRLRPGDRFGT